MPIEVVTNLMTNLEKNMHGCWKCRRDGMANMTQRKTGNSFPGVSPGSFCGLRRVRAQALLVIVFFLSFLKPRHRQERGAPRTAAAEFPREIC